MDAVPSNDPTDQALNGFGLGKLDDRSVEAVVEYLEHCPDCRRRVAGLPADSFLGRDRDAQAPGTPATGPSMTGATPGSALASPAADTLPPGLADHPDHQNRREL